MCYCNKQKKKRFSFKSFYVCLGKQIIIGLTYLATNSVCGQRVKEVVGFKQCLTVLSKTIRKRLESLFEFNQDFFKQKLKDISIQGYNTTNLYTRVSYNCTALSNVQTVFIVHIFNPVEIHVLLSTKYINTCFNSRLLFTTCL